MATTTKTKKKGTLISLRELAVSFIPESSALRLGSRYGDCPFKWKDEDIKNEVLENTESSSELLSYSFLDKGENKIMHYCTHCKKTFIKPFVRFARAECPTCGKVTYGDYVSFGSFPHITLSNRSIQRASVLYVDSESFIVAFYSYKETYMQKEIENDLPTETDFEDVLANRDIHFSNLELYMFHKDYGFRRVTESGTSHVKLDSLKWKSGDFIETDKMNELRKLLTQLGVINADTIKSFQALAKEALDIETKSTLTARKNELIRKQKIKEEDEMYLSYDSPDVEQLILSNNLGCSGAIPYDSKNNIKRAIMACPCCGKVSIAEYTPDDRNAFCPECGETVKVAYYSKVGEKTTEYFYDWGVAPDKSLICTLYLLKSVIDPVQMSVIRTVEKGTIHVFQPQKAITYSGGIRSNRFNFYENNYPLVNAYRGKNNIKDIIKQSCFQTSGLIEAMGIGDKVDLEPFIGYQSIPSYLTSFIRLPFIELTIKCGMKRLTQSLCALKRDELSRYNLKAHTIQEAFGLTKPVFKMARENNLSLKTMEQLKQCYELDQTMSWEDFDWVITTYHNAYQAINAMEMTGVKLHRLREYVTSCYYNQCIDYVESLRLWLDYCKMMKNLNFSQKSFKKELFPSSLKKSHDVLNFASMHIKDSKNFEVFKDTVESAKKYRYTFGDYLLTTPESAEDIVEEGINLSHSVAQHIELVANKHEFICFIRRKSAPEESFYTVELRDKDIIQVRGFSNRPVVEESVMYFLKKWAKFKNLTIVSL